MIVFLPIEVKNAVFITFHVPVVSPTIYVLLAVSNLIDTFRDAFSHVNRIYNYNMKTKCAQSTRQPNNR